MKFLCLTLALFVHAALGFEETVCEHKDMSLSCGAMGNIVILKASYGRHDKTTCMHPSIKTEDCNAEPSVSKVKEACQGKKSCKVTASNGVFGDPCVGTFKYLQVEYICSAMKSQEMVCEHQTMTLSCGLLPINILKASYGRHDGTTCPHRATKEKDCDAKATSVPKVKAACQGKKSCSVEASNSVFGDPCVGTFKYLDVEYACGQALVCEHKTLELKCAEEGSVIQILGASYGRHNGATCEHPAMSNKACHAGKSKQIVADQCDGKQSCTVKASNGVFKDPCRGTFKYLQVNYGCVEA